MLRTEKEKAICQKYSALDETGHVHCVECPLVVDGGAMMCRATANYDKRLREYVPDWWENEEKT